MSMKKLIQIDIFLVRTQANWKTLLFFYIYIPKEYKQFSGHKI